MMFDEVFFKQNPFASEGRLSDLGPGDKQIIEQLLHLQTCDQ